MCRAPGQRCKTFGRLSTSLTNPPVERLGAELEVLRTEKESRPSSPVEGLLALRYGARAYGLIGYEELGFHTVTAQEINHWSRRWFCAENAALTYSGPEPLDLVVPLPHGRRTPPPPAEPLRRRLPAWIALDQAQGVVTASFHLPRTVATVALGGLIRTHALRLL